MTAAGKCICYIASVKQLKVASITHKMLSPWRDGDKAEASMRLTRLLPAESDRCRSSQLLSALN